MHMVVIRFCGANCIFLGPLNTLIIDDIFKYFLIPWIVSTQLASRGLLRLRAFSSWVRGMRNVEPSLVKGCGFTEENKSLGCNQWEEMLFCRHRGIKYVWLHLNNDTVLLLPVSFKTTGVCWNLAMEVKSRGTHMPPNSKCLQLLMYCSQGC